MGRFDDERREMVELLAQRGISSTVLLKAMERIERHLFVPEPFTGRSYEDSALPIGRGQTISQPYTVAIMTEALDVRQGSRVLEVGTGSGYQAAILAEMGARVYTIERDAELLAVARKTLDRLGYRVAAKVGDGTVGWSEFAPYDGIIVTAGAPQIPEPLQKQLADGGKLVIPVGDLEVQRLAVVSRRGSAFERHDVDGFKFVPLIGKMGWSA